MSKEIARRGVEPHNPFALCCLTSLDVSRRQRRCRTGVRRSQGEGHGLVFVGSSVSVVTPSLIRPLFGQLNTPMVGLQYSAVAVDMQT